VLSQVYSIDENKGSELIDLGKSEHKTRLLTLWIAGVLLVNF
jgi:hypothetical protein